MAADQAIYYAVIGLSAFLTGLSKGGLGGTMGVLITPLLSLVMPIDQAIGLALPIFMVGDVFALAAHWRMWDRRLIWLLLPGALIGITLGTFVLTSISPEGLKLFLAAIIFLFILYKLLEQRIIARIHYRAHRWHGWLAGAAAGFTSTVAHAGGPPVVIYLLLQGVAPTVFVATSVLFFTVTNWIKVPYYYQAGLLDFQSMLGILWLAPLVPLGVWTGRRLTHKADRLVFERIILSLLGVTGLFLLFS
jgi:uncharacterized membrane protein YfcA